MLGGPVVVFALVVIGGFLLVPSQDPFSVTVFVHGEGGEQEVPLRGKGLVWLTLGPDRRSEPIGAKGEATFSGIPANFRGQQVPVWVEAEGFALANPAASRWLGGSSLSLAVKRQAVILRGSVRSAEGPQIAGATVLLRGLVARSGPDGSFELTVSGSLTDDDLILSISAPGYKPWHWKVVPRSNDVVAILERSQ